jgi:O-antigen/teichoic acid export membrane protein
LRRRSLLAGAGMGVVVTGGLAASAPWLVPAVFGAGFRDSVTLIWLLAPTGVLAPATKVCADLIRGHGRPLVVAGVQAASAAIMTALLFGLVPASGGHGAAVAASSTAVISFVLMVSMLRRTAHRVEAASVRDGSPV